MSVEPQESGTQIIVVGEPQLYSLLGASGASWRLEERQESIEAMWAALAAGRISSRARVLVFSDSLAVGQAHEAREIAQTAQAIVTMADAGARVFVASAHQRTRDALWAQVEAYAISQELDPNQIVVHFLDLHFGGRAVLQGIAQYTEDLVKFPEPLPADIDVILGMRGDDANAVRNGTLALRMPALPFIGGIGEPQSEDSLTPEVPAAASMELLNRAKPPGQTTITVTSSKGGSGKSTASIMLAAAIARASKQAGAPLSVCIVDLDTRDGQVASLIGRFMPTALNIRVQPVWDEECIRSSLVKAETLDVYCLLAPIRPRTADAVGPDFYRAIVRSLQRMFDVIVIDTSVLYLEPLIASVALVEADEILFVTNLASTAIQGMARALREITSPLEESGLGISREKLGIVVNQSAANVGMEQEQVLAAGLGMPVVGVIPLATRDVLTATNLNRMHELLDHPNVGPAYYELAHACLADRPLADWASNAAPEDSVQHLQLATEGFDPETERRRMSFQR
ncbi:MAG: AAA family ATPase [Actinomycetota bacterium]|nr:AAA family ATPase [Actinomycetota bacterium]